MPVPKTAQVGAPPAALVDSNTPTSVPKKIWLGSKGSMTAESAGASGRPLPLMSILVQFIPAFVVRHTCPPTPTPMKPMMVAIAVLPVASLGSTTMLLILQPGLLLGQPPVAALIDRSTKLD